MDYSYDPKYLETSKATTITDNLLSFLYIFTLNHYSYRLLLKSSASKNYKPSSSFINKHTIFSLSMNISAINLNLLDNNCKKKVNVGRELFNVKIQKVKHISYYNNDFIRTSTDVHSLSVSLYNHGVLNTLKDHLVQ